MLYRSLPAKLSARYFHGFLSVQHAVSLPPSEALPKLFPRFPSVQHAVSLPPTEAFRQLFARFPLCPACCLAPFRQRLPPSYFHGFLSVQHAVSVPSSEALSASYFHGFRSVQHAVSLPPSEALRKRFPWFPLRPTCCVAPSHAVSLPPGEAFRKLFPRYPIRPACCLAPLPAKLFACYFHGFLSVQHAVSLLPAKLSESYLHGFLSGQHAVSLPPTEALPKLSLPSSEAFSQAISNGFLSVQHAVSPPPGEAFRTLFPCIAPSRRNFPQAISTVSSPSSILSCSLSISYFHGFLSVQHAVSLPSSEPLSASYFHGFQSVQHAVSLPLSEAFRKLFLRYPIRPACCLRFPLRPACCLAPCQRSFPHAICTCTISYPSSMLSRSLPAKFSTSYFHVSSPSSMLYRFSQRSFRKLFAQFPLRPACCLAPSRGSSPQALQHAVSLPPSAALRKLLYVFVCLPAKLSARYLHGFLSVQHAVSLPPSEALRKLFPRFPLRPACCIPSPSEALASYLHCFVSVQHAVSVPPGEALRKLYLHGFLSVQHAVSLPPTEALRKLFAWFPLRPACCLAPSQRSFPQTISTVSSPSSMLSRSLPTKLSPSYFHCIPSFQHAVSLPPSEALRKRFPRFPLCPACCLALSQRSFPQALSTVSHPSSMLSRSLPAKLSPSYFHDFLSVQHAVSLPSSEALRKLFARFPVRPACCLAPSQRSSPQAICMISSPSSMLSRSLPAKLSQAVSTVSSPSSMLYRFSQRSSCKLFTLFPLRPACCPRSLPAKLSASYFHGFLSVQHAVSLPPSEALRKLYLHGFLSVQHAVSVPPGEALRKLFPRFPFRPACCLAPSQRSFPQTLVSHPSSMLSRFLPAKGLTVSSPSSMLSRSLQAKLSASYLHGFLSVQHAVSLPPSVALRKRFPRFCLRPTCLIASSYKASRKLFPRFPVRPACCIVPLPAKLSASYLHGFLSVQLVLSCSLPEKLSARYLHGFLSSSMLSRSLPAKLSARYLHGFLSVQHAVSLPPSEAFPKLFQRFPLRPACCLAPSQLSASYLHGFLSVQHAVSLPPREALRKLFPWLPIRPACCLAPSQRSSPQAISTVPVSLPPSEAPRKRYFHGFRPSSMLSRSLPRKLSTSYLHGFLSVQHAVSAIYLHPLPSSLPSFLLSFLLPPSLPSFLPSFLPPLLLGKNTTRWMGDSSGFSSVFFGLFHI